MISRCRRLSRSARPPSSATANQAAARIIARLCGDDTSGPPVMSTTPSALVPAVCSFQTENSTKLMASALRITPAGPVTQSSCPPPSPTAITQSQSTAARPSTALTSAAGPDASSRRVASRRVASPSPLNRAPGIRGNRLVHARTGGRLAGPDGD